MKSKSQIILLILGMLLFLLSVVNSFTINFNIGILIIYGISIIFLLYGLFFDKLIKIKWLTYSIATICALTIILMLFIGFYGKSDNVTFNENAVIVLGAGIKGETVSLTLSYRLDKAAEYITKNSDAVIVVSGGQGFQENITEALAMERYLISKGVPKEKIIKEEMATSTYENLLFSKEILDAYFTKPYKTVVITNDFHIYRATKLAKKLGFDIAHYHAKTGWYALPLNYSRECIAVIKIWLLGK